MKGRKKVIIPVAAVVVIAAFYFFQRNVNQDARPESMREIRMIKGTIADTISTTGTVEPKNRLEIIPEISGRAEKVLVAEGDFVKAGTILVWMSSSERAALIDAARAQGKKSVQYWEEAYKPIPIIAPITGTIIVRSIEPGQSVNTSTAILVLSDRLTVKAIVDETDIGRVRTGQKALIGLDAYPDVKAVGVVDSISFESATVNNVTTYEVNILPQKVPEVFRSGMSANIEIIKNSREDIFMLPVEAVIFTNNGSFVMTGEKNRLVRKPVETGISDGNNIEIVSGLGPEDNVYIVSTSFMPDDADDEGRNLFGPPRRPGKNKK
ncbi:MAG: efflux RND transporter periplasmic adaptor subunit [Spirochaetes bacterium]|nr:efflux RND transporter periplasmic adaptor subunit [Spirochaetota bacterium]